MIGPEYLLQCVVVDWLDRCLKPPAWFTSIEHGVRLSPATARRLQRIQVKPGIPDVGLFHLARAFFIELKGENGVVSGAQIVTHAALERAGCPVAVCRSLDDVRRAVAIWGIPTRDVSHFTVPKMRVAS